MTDIPTLKKTELALMQKHREGLFKSKNAFRKAIERFLDQIASGTDGILTYEEWNWASKAIICWESLLRSEFGTLRGTRIPEFPSSGQTTHATDYAKEGSRVKDESDSLSTIGIKETLEKIAEEQIALRSKFEQHEQQSKEEHAALAMYEIATSQLISGPPRSTQFQSFADHNLKTIRRGRES